MKKIIEKIAIALYFIGLFAFPIYKVFIEAQVQIDGFPSFYKLVLKFLFYLVCCWFMYTPVCAIIASFFFLKGDDAKDMRYGCGYPSLAIISIIICVVLYNKCHNDTNTTKTNSFYKPEKEYRHTPAIKSEKIINYDEDIEDPVYICTGPQSRRLRNSMSRTSQVLSAHSRLQTKWVSTVLPCL